MIAAYKRRAVYWGVPGFLVQTAGYILGLTIETPKDNWAFFFVSISLMYGGAAVLGIGLAHLAKAKGRHGAWGTFALLSFLGVLFVAALPDRTVRTVPLVCSECGYDLRGGHDQCPECGKAIDDQRADEAKELSA